MLRVVVRCAALFLAGCSAHGQDPHLPGDPLGTFHVSAQLQKDSCQAAFLGVVDPWQFDVELSRTKNALYWLNGSEAVPGELAADGQSFSLTSGVEEPATTDVESFTGTLSFTYADADGSDCSPWVGVGDGFANLPCTVAYHASAERTKAPRAN